MESRAAVSQSVSSQLKLLSPISNCYVPSSPKISFLSSSSKRRSCDYNHNYNCNDKYSRRTRFRVRRRKSEVVHAVATPTPAVERTKSDSPSKSNDGSSNSLSNVRTGIPSRVGDMSQEIKRVRAQMEENEQLAILMRGLRGQNLTDSQFADDNIQLRLVEVDESSEFLPLVYDPASISSYWGKRPRAVATRIVQLLSVAGGFISRLALDVINKKVKENEVARAIELREIVTSLGPAYIKLGQALSIRPDILSPVAMTELQKLCDKVPSFPDDVAMALIEEELGKPWHELYSELSPSPIAAASLGQVYKGRLKETGDLVAVKVQRPFVLETVTVDLFVIRHLGLVLRKFPQISIDVVGLVDEWAARFFEELDYVNEGENGTRFAEMMRKDLPQKVFADCIAEAANWTQPRRLQPLIIQFSLGSPASHRNRLIVDNIILCMYYVTSTHWLSSGAASWAELALQITTSLLAWFILTHVLLSKLPTGSPIIRLFQSMAEMRIYCWMCGSHWREGRSGIYLREDEGEPSTLV